MKAFLSFAAILAFCATAPAAPPAFPEGEILFRHTDGPVTTDFRLTKSTTALRIEQVGETIPPPPTNLISLGTGDITIINPINRSTRIFPAATFDPPPPADPAEAWKGPTPFSPPSGPAQRLFQEPPAESKFLAAPPKANS